jgi:hypothetical protein
VTCFWAGGGESPLNGTKSKIGFRRWSTLYCADNSIPLSNGTHVPELVGHKDDDLDTFRIHPGPFHGLPSGLLVLVFWCAAVYRSLQLLVSVSHSSSCRFYVSLPARYVSRSSQEGKYPLHMNS